MQVTETKSLPYFGFYKTLGSVGVPAFGIMVLLVVALQFSRSAAGSLDRLFLGTVTLGVAVIAVSYYQHRRGLNQLYGKIDDRALSGLCRAANSMACFGYSTCMMALMLVHRH
jgi:hypothetical protein